MLKSHLALNSSKGEVRAWDKVQAGVLSSALFVQLVPFHFSQTQNQAPHCNTVSFFPFEGSKFTKEKRIRSTFFLTFI